MSVQPRFHTGFFGESGKNGATPPRVVGVCSPRKCLKFMCSELLVVASVCGLKKIGDCGY